MGLGLRRLRNGTTAASAINPAQGAVNLTSLDGGTDQKRVGRWRARDIGSGSVAQCFEQVPSMYFDEAFSLQVGRGVGYGWVGVCES